MLQIPNQEVCDITKLVILRVFSKVNIYIILNLKVGDLIVERLPGRTEHSKETIRRNEGFSLNMIQN